MRQQPLDGRRYYYPWNPLQLSTSVDSGARVRKNSVNFETFRTYRMKIIWSALLNKNAAYFLSEGCSMLEHIELLCTQASKTPLGSVTISFYDFTGEHEEDLLPLDEDYSFFTYHPYKDSLEHFLTNLIDHRSEVRIQTRELELLEAPNKMNQIIMFVVGESLLAELKSPLRLQMFKSLLENSADERIYLFPFFTRVREVPESLFKSFSHCYFLGEDFGEYAREELYPEWRVSRNSFAQELVGYGVVSEEEKLYALHNWKYTESEWEKNRKQAISDEEELYREYLKSLEEEV